MEELLSGLPLQLIPLAELGKHIELPPLVEDQPTFTGNAVKKAETLARASGEMALADDSGLCVEALNGQPGIYSARFAGPGADDEANNRLLLELLRDIPPEKRRAEFHCAIAVAFPCGNTYILEDKCSGRIAETPQGGHGFGYDPLFIYEPRGVTFAQLEPAVKNAVSHRGKALRKVRSLMEWLTGCCLSGT